LCKQCQVETHFDHIQEIQGLDSLFTEAVKAYTQLIATIEKHLAAAIPGKEGLVDEALPL